ncbi:MAG: hypothetical protein P8185_07985 [Deltaproteobacteria bacterium]
MITGPEVVTLACGIHYNPLMIFITQGFKQDFLDICIGGLLEKICAKRKFNTTRSQNGIKQLEGDFRFFDADIDNFGIQFFILKKILLTVFS